MVGRTPPPMPSVPIPAGLGVASGFPVASLLLCSGSLRQRSLSNLSSAAPVECAGRRRPRLAHRSPGAAQAHARGLVPSPRPAQVTGSARCSVSGHDGDGCRASLGEPLAFAPARYPRAERGPEGQCHLTQTREGCLRGPRSARASWRWRKGGWTPGEKGGRCVWKTVPWADQGRRLKGGRVPRMELEGTLTSSALLSEA